jgi:uncharacterized protein
MRTQTLHASSKHPTGAIAGLLPYFLVGVLFGFVLVKGEVVSWFRMQEMFRFGGFHMYGILGSALAVAALSLALIRRFGIRTIRGEEIGVPPKKLGAGTRYWAGGTTFGVGWALTGACPGPIFALIGYGLLPFVIVLLFAVLGMWIYGQVRERLPH